MLILVIMCILVARLIVGLVFICPRLRRQQLSLLVLLMQQFLLIVSQRAETHLIHLCVLRTREQRVLLGRLHEIIKRVPPHATHVLRSLISFQCCW